MERNSGKTLKVIAIIIGILGIIAAIIIGAITGSVSYSDGLGFGTFLGVAAAALITAVMLYGFGELIDNSAQINAKMDKTEKQLNELKFQLSNLSASQPTAAPQPVVSTFGSNPDVSAVKKAPSATQKVTMAPAEKKDALAMPAEFESLKTAKDIYLTFFTLSADKPTEDNHAMEKILIDLCQREERGEPSIRDSAISRLRSFYKYGCRVFTVDRSGTSFTCPNCGKESERNRKVCHDCGALFRD